jgi:hypothetical protein
MYKKLLLMILTISIVSTHVAYALQSSRMPIQPEQVVPWPNTEYEDECPAYGCEHCQQGTPDMFNDNLPTLDNPNM